MYRTAQIPIVEFEAFRRRTREHRVASYVRATVRANIMYQWDSKEGRQLTSGDNVFHPQNQLEQELWNATIAIAKNRTITCQNFLKTHKNNTSTETHQN